MKRLSFFTFCFFLFALSFAQSFVRGADVSWCSEMEADGKLFYNDAGEETELMTLLHDIGMDAVRLRVWVNPENDYGAWCDKADVLAKAKRASQKGLDIMLDFHYSDLFADPGRQAKPKAWEGLSFEQLKEAVAEHTADILKALKEEGIEPRWVQVGNETRNGMIWDDGKLWTNTPDKGFVNYAALSNAGYDAVKQVFPNAIVIVHIDRGKEDNAWFFKDFKQYGGKFDMIGLSHYPASGSWNTDNEALAKSIKSIVANFSVPVMIVETGFPNWNDETREQGRQAMTNLFEKTEIIEGCSGIFYWEPQLYDWWKPDAYTRWGWNAYNMGAFTWNGRPGPLLDPFRKEVEPDAVSKPKAIEEKAPRHHYNLQGQPVDASFKGVVVAQNKKLLIR